ncbi:MAG: hypothetical protein ACT6UH_00560 [Hydrogenophaga sp.]|uniref:hypothetical protein n=1 Tax=Hydrogenophaga sp. TaxID=1904254 RepID=UPI0040374D01
MKRRTFVQTCARWVIAPVAFLALMAFGAILDDPRAAQAIADDAAQAVLDAQQQADDDAYWQRICRHEFGPGAQLLRTHDGDVVCRPATHVAKGGVL